MQQGGLVRQGSAGLIGIALLFYGISALILGGHGLRVDPIDGTVNGKTWLGIEVNVWSSLLFTGAASTTSESRDTTRRRRNGEI